MPYGLRDDDLAQIIEILKGFSDIESAVLFGSRAKGNYKPGSDVDLAIMGSKATLATASEVAYRLDEETLMPYFFDVVLYSALDEPNLKAHIDRVGIKIFVADAASQ
ncbi:MAG: nucleotidyltransferase domain-containing protein [Leptolyngbya sp. SIO4C1]|nr:nucleotidyltransferase domain-containing protein [Leptolyngbya sp. SIO4C1]